MEMAIVMARDAGMNEFQDQEVDGVRSYTAMNVLSQGDQSYQLTEVKFYYYYYSILFYCFPQSILLFPVKLLWFLVLIRIFSILFLHICITTRRLTGLDHILP